MALYSNTSQVSLSLAVFLATDHYDHSTESNEISATTLIKPLRQIILAARVPATDANVDLINMAQSRMGTAVHDGIEHAWKNNYKDALKTLGYPKQVINRVVINPTESDVEVLEDMIPIYLEQRSKKQVGNFTVTGKYDFVGDGRLEDFKTTSVYTAIHNTNDTKYCLQGSIYRWLNPKVITKDEMAIQFMFTDWQKMKAMSDPKYPQQRIQQRIIPLKSIQETEAFVTSKLNQITQHWNTEEAALPLCSDEDLWRSAPVYKYYKNPTKTARSTKNYDDKQDAYLRLAEDGNVGIVIESPGQVTACKYCSAFSICSQKDYLIAAGDLLMS